MSKQFMFCDSAYGFNESSPITITILVRRISWILKFYRPEFATPAFPTITSVPNRKDLNFLKFPIANMSR